MRFVSYSTDRGPAWGVLAPGGVLPSGLFGQACPLFVPLAEEGWLTQPVTRLVAAEYLGSFKSHSIDTLILGCTHYPMLKPVIADVMGPEVTLIDSAEETARELRSLLTEADLMSHPSDRPLQSYFVSDVPRRFREVAERLGLASI